MPTITERLTGLGLVGAGLRRVEVATPQGPLSVLTGGRPSSGPPVVLLHGMGSCAADLGGLLRRLRGDSGALIAPDLPGHGHSAVPVAGLEPDRMAAQITAALRGLIDRPAVVFGSSLGGLVALHFAQQAPEKVAALVLASPAGAPMAALDRDDFFDQLRVRDHADARRFVDKSFARTRVPRRLLAWGLQERFGQPHIAQLLDRARGDHFLDAAALGGLSMPVTLLWGEGDQLMPDAHFEWFARHLPPGSRVQRLRDAGHAPYLERPGAVSQAIRDALAASLREAA